MQTFHPFAYVIAGIVIGFISVVLYGHYLIQKRKKRLSKIVSDTIRNATTHGNNPNNLYAQIFGRAQRPQTDVRNTLYRLKMLNPERCKAFGHSVDQMPLTFWATAVAGETGELCNLIKKMERGDKYPFTYWQNEVGKEAADIVIYLDLLCTKIGIDLEKQIISKFNEVSDRVKSPIKL
jgi:NTP pyrophosphatase (non-canonical NTP hydrolase)